MIGCIYAHACDTHVNTEPTKYDILHFQINNISDHAVGAIVSCNIL